MRRALLCFIVIGLIFEAVVAALPSGAKPRSNPCYPAQVRSSYWDDATPKGWHTQLHDYQCSDGRVVFVRQP